VAHPGTIGEAAVGGAKVLETVAGDEVLGQAEPTLLVAQDSKECRIHRVVGGVQGEAPCSSGSTETTEVLEQARPWRTTAVDSGEGAQQTAEVHEVEARAVVEAIEEALCAVPDRVVAEG